MANILTLNLYSKLLLILTLTVTESCERREHGPGNEIDALGVIRHVLCFPISFSEYVRTQVRCSGNEIVCFLAFSSQILMGNIELYYINKI
jgi:hypothetical protein